MNKRVLMIAAAIVIAIVSGTLYLLARPGSQSDQAANNTGSLSQQTNKIPAAAAPAPGGTYIDYEDGIIAKTEGTKLLFFHAPWCPQCRDLETDIKKQGVPRGVAIIKIDYDTNQDLRKKYGVTLQTTFVKITDGGDLEKKFVAYDDPVLSSVTQNLLQ